MADVVIDLKDAAKWFDVTEKAARKAAMRGLLSAALRSVQTIITVIIPSRSPPPVDKGGYLAGWHAVKNPEGAEFFNASYEAPFVEDGVRAENVKPGRAMIAAITEWATRKGLAADADEARSVAFAIAQNMKRLGIFNRGSKGLGIMRELVDKYLDQYVAEEVEREMAKVWRRQHPIDSGDE